MNVNHDKKKKSRGFTLIELLVVVSIIGILAGIAMVSVKHAQRRAQEAALKMNLQSMRKAIDDFYADKRRFPTSLQELVDEKYLRNIPKDPITGSADTWQVVTEEPALDGSDDSDEEDAAAAGPGISDVKSGAEGETLPPNPSPYSEL